MIFERFRLGDRVAIVTGAGRGIGRASALALAEAGADVAVAARRQEDLDAVVESIERLGRRGLAVPCDVNAGEQLDALVAKTLERFGRIDVVVNNAGGTPPTPMLQLSDETFEAAFHFNVTSAMRLSRLAIPSMLERDGGSIVNISSALGHMVESGFVAYGTAKAALSHMKRLMAAEFAPRVRVNALAVGATVTDALSPFLVAGDLQQRMEALTPMARLGTPEDIACAVLYLASPAASWVTGKIFEIDGGTVDSNWPIKIPGY